VRLQRGNTVRGNTVLKVTMALTVSSQILGLDTRCGPTDVVCPCLLICQQKKLIIISFHNSPVFDPATGFGGTGVPGTYTLPKDEAGTSKFFDPESFVGCVADGPFSSYTIHLGPGKLVTDHCLVRGINSTYTRYFSSSAVANATSLPTFEKFRIELEGMPITPTHKMHDGAHMGVGGEMSNFYSSPAG